MLAAILTCSTDGGLFGMLVDCCFNADAEHLSAENHRKDVNSFNTLQQEPLK